jgi:predicted PurR-regulated permease PerM
MNEKFFERILSLVIVFALILACLRITSPLLGALAWAIIIVVSTWPFFVGLKQLVAGHANLAAILVTLLLLIVFVLPLLLIGRSLTEHAENISHLSSHLSDLHLPPPPAWVAEVPVFGGDILRAWQALSDNMAQVFKAVEPYLEQGVKFLLSQSAHLGLAILEFFLAVLLSGVILANGEYLHWLVTRFARKLHEPGGNKLLKVAELNIRGVTWGVIGTALIESILVAAGLYMAGMQAAVLLGFAGFLAAMVQVGTRVVWVPAAIWLGYQGQHGWMIFIVVWGLTINTLCDHFLKPYLISRGTGTPMAIILVGVIGGLLAWGVLGIFLGPTLLAVTYVLLLNWLEERNVY